MYIKFIDYVTDLFETLNTSGLAKLNLSSQFTYESFFASIHPKFSIEKLKSIYRESITETIEARLNYFANAVQDLRSLKEVNYYENSISIYTCFFIFWILDNEIKMTKRNQEKLCEAIFIGTVGYRLLDLNQDHDKIGKEALMLGYYLINLGEEILSEIFPFKDTFYVIKKYNNLYTQVEYEEKKNRWKNCPFRWKKAFKIGYKASPVFAIFELLFRLDHYDEKKIQSLIEAILYVLTTTQMCDDIVDAKEDLSNGFETLVMTDFYKTYGVDKEVTDEDINVFLNFERMKKFFETNVQLFEKSRIIFTNNNEYILLLLLELKYFQFIDSFQIYSK